MISSDVALYDCVVCSNNGGRFFRTKESFAHARCPDCGTVSVISPPSEAALFSLYQKDEGYSVPVHSGIEHFDEIIRFGLNTLGSARVSIIDVGCASGNFLAQFPENCTRFGCDVNEHDIALAKNRGLDNVFVGTLRDCKISPETFDWVHLGDVLEHVVNPPELLHEAVRTIRPGGLVTVGTPDIESWWARFSFYADRLIGGGSSVLSPPYHLVNLSKRALIDMCAREGLEVVSSWSRSPSLSYEIRSAAKISTRTTVGIRHFVRLFWIAVVFGGGFGVSWFLRTVLRMRIDNLHLTVVFRKMSTP